MSDWIQTYTGRKFFPLDPAETDVDIEDIAHHLALTNRFRGATHAPYSVAEHCVRIARRLPEELALAGLLHDAAEAYLADIPHPVKQALFVDIDLTTRAVKIGELEDHVLGIIYRAFGLDVKPLSDARVKAEDLRALATERRDLMRKPPAPWILLERVEPWPEKITPWEWRTAEAEYLNWFYRLTERTQ